MSTVQKTEAVKQSSILDWISDVHEQLRAGPTGELLEFNGIDVAEVLLSPLYLAALNALRSGPAKKRSRGRMWFERARNWAYWTKIAFRTRRASRRSAQPGPADFLLWSRDITHSLVLHPVTEALRQRGASARLLSCNTTVFDALLSQDPSTVLTRAAWTNRLKEAHSEGSRRAAELAKSSSWSLPPLGDRSGEQMEKSVRRVLTVLLPVALETAVAADAALDAFGSKLLVVGNDLTLEGRIGCRIAGKRGVPTAVFMHGSIAGDPLQSRHIADKIFVNGSIHIRELVEQGVPASKVVVCGAPNLDKRPRQSGLIHPLLQSRLGLRSGRPWILVATSGPGHRISHKHHQVVIENLARLAAELADVPMVVKLHRKDRLEYYQQALQNQRHRLILVREESSGFPRGIFEWLTGCSVVLTGASTVAVEAMLMDVPVITMDFCQEIRGVDFIDAGATTHVQNPEALRDAVRHCLASGTSSTGQAVRKYLGEAYFALDGRSSDRAAASLVEMAGA